MSAAGTQDEADERALEQCKEKNNSCVLYFSGKKYVYWKRLNVKQICSEWRISMDFTSRDREEHRLTLSKLLEGKGYAYNYCSNPNFDTQHTIKKLKRQKEEVEYKARKAKRDAEEAKEEARRAKEETERAKRDAEDDAIYPVYIDP